MPDNRWNADRKLITRREFLRQSGGLCGALALTGFSPLALSAVRSLDRLVSFPFTLGVASGDPTPDSLVLWTRLAREALEEVGAQQDALRVHFEVADSERFTRIVRQGFAVASPELGHSVHVDIRGLEPGREYFYRWQIGDAVSAVGRTRTAPLASSNVDQFRFAFASCQQFEHGYYTAYRHMADENLDLIVHLGDYIYERSWGQNLVRAHEGPEILTLDNYRARYGTYKSDPDLQAAHASAPWVVTWDDHEVDNNYANAVPEDDQTPEQFLRRRAAAYQAWYEFMPVRLPVGRQGPDMPIHRRLRFGRLMEMQVLDTRQYRSDQACGDGRKASCAAHQDTTRTLLGSAQKHWLFNNLSAADATWNVLAQQIMMASLRSLGPDNEELWPMDIWDGYPYERAEILRHLEEVATPNPVVLTGDIHSNWVADLTEDFDREVARVIATELVGTSITSGGDGEDMTDNGRNLLSNNPHVKFHNGQRGYVSNTLTPGSWVADFKVLPRVTAPGAAISTRASFAIEAGRPGAQRA